MSYLAALQHLYRPFEIYWELLGTLLKCLANRESRLYQEHDKSNSSIIDVVLLIEGSYFSGCDRHRDTLFARILFNKYFSS